MFGLWISFCRLCSSHILIPYVKYFNILICEQHNWLNDTIDHQSLHTIDVARHNRHKIFFTNISAFCTFTSNDPRRNAFLTYHCLLLPKPGDTRWYYPARVIKVSYSTSGKLLEIFETVTEQPDVWNDESLDTSDLLHFLNSSFYFFVSIFYKKFRAIVFVFSASEYRKRLY